jgi:hypothetical protein
MFITPIRSDRKEPIYSFLLIGTATVGRPKTVLEKEYLFCNDNELLSNSYMENGAEQFLPTVQSLRSFALASSDVTHIELFAIYGLSGVKKRY